MENMLFDYEAKFFETYLEKYLGSDKDFIKVTEEDNNDFINFYSEYVNTDHDNKVSDSYMFFIASGLIKIENGMHFIDNQKLNDIYRDYKKVALSKVKKKSN